ncbi:hypothetical protein GGX14DRAFT_460390, partial [Mycena pura]
TKVSGQSFSTASWLCLLPPSRCALNDVPTTHYTVQNGSLAESSTAHSFLATGMLLLYMTRTSAHSPVPTPSKRIYVTSVPSAYLRSGPSTSHPIYVTRTLAR